MTIKDSVVTAIENIGGTALGDVECVISGPRSVNCFIVGEDSDLWTRELKNGKWEEWYSLGGALMEVPNCVSHSKGQIDCIGRSLDDNLYHKQYVPGEFKWRDFRTILELDFSHGKPSVVYEPETNLVTVYLEDEDHTAHYKQYNVDDDEWYSSDSINYYQKLYSPLSIVDWSNATFYFSRGQENRAVYFIYRKGTDPDAYNAWTDTYALESPVASEPKCLSTKDLTIDCFALGLDRTLQHISLRKPSQPWTAWKVSQLQTIGFVHSLFLADRRAFLRSTHVLCRVQGTDSLLRSQLHTVARRDDCGRRKVIEASTSINKHELPYILFSFRIRLESIYRLLI